MIMGKGSFMCASGLVPFRLRRDRLLDHEAPGRFALAY